VDLGYVGKQVLVAGLYMIYLRFTDCFFTKHFFKFLCNDVAILLHSYSMVLKKQTPVVQRLLSEVRKYSTDKARIAWRRRGKQRKKIKLSAADKALAAAKRKTERIKYSEALANSRKVVMDEAIKLHEMFGAHTVDYYYEQLLQGHRLARSKRNVSRWNIWLRKEVQRLNDGKQFYILYSYNMF
jgi:hypothetical protein